MQHCFFRDRERKGGRERGRNKETRACLSSYCNANHPLCLFISIYVGISYPSLPPCLLLSLSLLYFLSTSPALSLYPFISPVLSLSLSNRVSRSAFKANYSLSRSHFRSLSPPSLSVPLLLSLWHSMSLSLFCSVSLTLSYSLNLSFDLLSHKLCFSLWLGQSQYSLFLSLPLWLFHTHLVTPPHTHTPIPTLGGCSNRYTNLHKVLLLNRTMGVMFKVLNVTITTVRNLTWLGLCVGIYTASLIPGLKCLTPLDLHHHVVLLYWLSAYAMSIFIQQTL